MNCKTIRLTLSVSAFCLVGSRLGTAVMAQTQHSPYINKVYEYCPAPGQFVNDLPEWEVGDDVNDMRLKAEDCIANHSQIMISLGAWGGYVVFGFDHTIPNVPGEYDLKILGNAFYAAANPNDTAALGGSAEPGIVMVSYDANGNGRPDDPWYELAGSEHSNPLTIHGYECTYYRTPQGHVATPYEEYPYLSDTTYIRWTDNRGGQGYVSKNVYHRQDYFPAWIDADELTFRGTRLRNNGIDESGTGHYYVLYQFDWGYVDNQPNHAGSTDNGQDGSVSLPHVSEFKIDWAVDADGKSVYLPGVDFVKVYTGVNQYNGWLGEASTEILDAWDLHMLDADGKVLPSTGTGPAIRLPETNPHTGMYRIDGRRTDSLAQPGIYVVRTTNGVKKVVVR